MLCSKCYENIPQGKEIKVEGSIICQKCALVIEKTNKKEVIARCWNCNHFIYKGELIHEISRNDSKNWINWLLLNLENYEKMAQCDDCYQEWRRDVKKVKSLSGIRFLLLGVCVGYFLCFLFELFFPEKLRKLDNSSIITFFVTLFIVIIILGPIIDVDRHKIKAGKKKGKVKK